MTHLRSIELLQYVRSHVPGSYYVNEFPATAKDAAAFIRVTGGYSPGEFVKRPSFQVVTRDAAANMSKAEAHALAIFDHFHDLRECRISEGCVLRNVMADQSEPIYLGRDDNSRPMYSINFTATIL